jgi:predicted nucleic acid-binding protein
VKGVEHAVGILDTSAVIALDRILVDDLPAEPAITAITLAELSVGPLVTDEPGERAARQARLQAVEATFEPIPFDDAAARSFGQVAAALRQSGRKVSARAFDALIAATALSRGWPVHTCNPDDFAAIDGLAVVAVRPSAVER